MTFKFNENYFSSKSSSVLTVLSLVAVSLCSFLLTFQPASVGAAPKLSGHFTEIPWESADSGYNVKSIFPNSTVDINNDGHQDLIILGSNYPDNDYSVFPANTPQASRVLLGDGEGGFVVAPNELFPVNELDTVHPRKVIFADFNADGRLDMFVACHGWDTEPFPGEQNRLFLSKPGGGWRNATANLPQLNDFSHTAAAGDINGDNKIDLYVGNNYGGDTRALPYTLINNGDGDFTLTRNNIPAGDYELLDFNRTGFMFPGANLIDLDGDNLPELILGAHPGPDFTSSDERSHTTIMWNNNGFFSENNKTVLPAPVAFANHIDLDVQSFDINQDGLLDLVITGSQAEPAFYDGWYVQILINLGNHQFIDETISRMVPADMKGGENGVVTNSPWPMWVQILDFNQDGFKDFSVEFEGHGYNLEQHQPFIWLNDGNGKFTTIKVGDFITTGNEWKLGYLNLTPTQHGYSIFTPNGFRKDIGGLMLTGLLATKPFHVPTIMTTSISNIENTDATSGGDIINSDGVEVTSRGACWSTNPAPTIQDQKTIDGTGMGVFQSNLTGLAANTTYYVRAWATSFAGIGYGGEIAFTTQEGLPTVTTNNVSSGGGELATSGGDVVNDGGVEVTSRGVCWSTNPAPTIQDQKTVDESGVGVFQSNLTGLAINTTYYVRAWAANSYGVVYGNEVIFYNTLFPWILFIPVISGSAGN